MFETITDLTKLGHNRLRGLITALRRESQGGLATRLAVETMRGPLYDAHAADAGPTEFDFFDTNPSTGDVQITGTVGGPDIDLYATTSATNEAGVIIVEQAPQWTMAAGAGGWQGWGIVAVEWGIQSNPFQGLYDATPTSGYGPRNVFAHDFRGHRHKPLHGRTIDSGGGITAHLRVRPLGPVNSVVVWPGGTLLAVSSAACTMIQKMQVWGPANYGPIHVRNLFSGGKEPATMGQGRKATMSRLLGGGAISKLLNGLSGIVDQKPPTFT